jgi:hypothetical protein
MPSRLVSTTWKNGNHRYSVDAEHVPGVTTLLGVMSKDALVAWSARLAAQWAANNPDQLAVLGHQAFVAQAAAAPNAARDAAGDVGRNLHTHAETLVKTGTVDVPLADLPLVEQAADFLDSQVVEVIASERAVFHEAFMYAGRLDLLATLRSQDGISLLDFKTSASGVWPEHALQQAAYRFCTHMQAEDPANDDEPMPPVAHAAIVWVRPEGWQLVPVRADREMWTQFLACIPLYNFRALKRDQVVGAPIATGKAVSYAQD